MIRSVKGIFAWYDFWIGLYYDRDKRILYLFLLPTIGIVVDLSRLKKSQQNGFRTGDIVECTFRNSGNKYWREHLDYYKTIKDIKWTSHDTSKIKLGDEWFYENDFKLKKHE